MDQLAPLPDFRYVGLEPVAPVRSRYWTGAALAGAASATLAAADGLGARSLLLGAATAMVSMLFLRGQSTPSAGPLRTLAIVPWGILVDHEEQPRVLRWAAVKSVHVETHFGRDTGSTTTLYSRVTIETEHERFGGRAYGAVSIERLLAHLKAYAEEQTHTVALDLEGSLHGQGPIEPDCEVLIGAARAFLESAPASSQLELPAMSYRSPAARATTPRTLEELRRVLRDRSRRTVDPRPFACVLAAELSAVEVVDDLVALVQSPHPIVAAVAKQAARKLGVSTARAGSLEEIAPFLLEEDTRALEAWAASG